MRLTSGAPSVGGMNTNRLSGLNSCTSMITASWLGSPFEFGSSSGTTSLAVPCSWARTSSSSSTRGLGGAGRLLLGAGLGRRSYECTYPSWSDGADRDIVRSGSSVVSLRRQLALRKFRLDCGVSRRLEEAAHLSLFLYLVGKYPVLRAFWISIGLLILETVSPRRDASPRRQV